MSDENERILWKSFKEDNSLAFGSLVKLHYKRLFHYGLKFSRDKEFLKDTIQDLFLELWNKRQTITEPAFIRTYLLKSLRNKIVREKQKTKRILESENIEMEADFPAIFSVETYIIEDENLRESVIKVRNLLNHLSKRQKEIIYLRYYHDLSHEEIAEVMSLSIQSVYNLLSRTIRHLKEIVDSNQLLFPLSILFSDTIFFL
jgi:RNA polymerase sigma-70 factor (ECF subfamily)